MGKFADRGRLPVQIEGDPHIIYIKAEMDVATRSAVLDALKPVIDGNKIIGFEAGSYELAELKHFVVGWSGPDLDGVDVTPDAISRMSAGDPLVREVAKVIRARYPLG